MDPSNINIIFNTSKTPLSDSSGNSITSCTLGNNNTNNNEFTPVGSYKNPVSWTEMIIVLVLNLFFIITFLFSEGLGWFVFYLSIVISIVYYIYVLAVFDYSYQHLLDNSNEYENPWYLMWIFVGNIFFYVVLFLCGISIFENKAFIIILSEIVIWGGLLLFCINDAYRYLLHKHLLLDVFQSMGVGKKPTPPPPIPTGPPPPEDEVFNITGNHFTYDDAKAVCKSYDAKLATYEQIEQAYQQGAEWVSYGWSEGQYAYFPLQKETWTKMNQDDPENVNGKIRPGISGGYFANPNILFGANCFGKKPKPRSQDLNHILPGLPPKKPGDIALDKKVDFYKQNATPILGFNSDQWFSSDTKKTQ